MRFLLVEDAGESPFPAAHVEHTLAGERSQMFANHFDVVDARIDGRGEVLLVGGCLVEG
ncbi:MAG: hypothetical protein WDO73_05195 [Ignavibacteriota bacterium]